jgi:hypothetical protein
MKTLLLRLMLVLLIPAFLLGCFLAACCQGAFAARDLWRKFWDEARHA